MNETVEIAVGSETWSVRVPDVKRVAVVRDREPEALDEAADLLRAALERPLGIDAPVRRAVTPDDKVAIVVDETLPGVGTLVGVLLEHLDSAGIPSSAVTLVVAPPTGGQDWIDDLPDAFDDVHVEVHDPDDITRLAYVANTKGGRRVYLNRTVAEADFVAVLSARTYHPTLGPWGAELALFPVLSDAETRAAFAHPPADADKPDLRGEAIEVLWLLGAPFLVQVIHGFGDGTAEVLVGLPGSSATGAKHLEGLWKCHAESAADLVIAAVSGDRDRVTLLDLAAAVNTARRAVKPDGRIVLLTDAAPMLDAATELLRRTDNPSTALKRVRAAALDDPTAAILWARAANSARLFVASGWPEEVVEELFAIAVGKPTELQRLIDAADTVAIIPDAHRTRIAVDEEGE